MICIQMDGMGRALFLRETIGEHVDLRFSLHPSFASTRWNKGRQRFQYKEQILGFSGMPLFLKTASKDAHLRSFGSCSMQTLV
jgi:hypothetical protein